MHADARRCKMKTFAAYYWLKEQHIFLQEFYYFSLRRQTSFV